MCVFFKENCFVFLLDCIKVELIQTTLDHDVTSWCASVSGPGGEMFGGKQMRAKVAAAVEMGGTTFVQ